MPKWTWRGLLLLSAACTHSDSFSYLPPVVGPLPSGADVRLTLNAGDDYWPSFTEDGSGILYAYVDPFAQRHRCVGLLRPEGGTRTWEMCHRGVAYDDSVSSFTGFALGADGRLIYGEAVSRFIAGTPSAANAAPQEITLWLADSAHPFKRTALLTLPVNIAGTAVSWLSQLQWTAPNRFIALGQYFAIFPHCASGGSPACLANDTVFSTGGAPADAGEVVVGTITAGNVVLTVVDGTLGATGYSLAEDGASIVFTQRNSGNLYKVPIGGGAVTNIGYAPSPLRPGYQVLGIGCVRTMCVAATDSVVLTAVTTPVYPSLRGGTRELRLMSLATGVASPLLTIDGVISSLAVSPLTGDVVLQIGGIWGHLQTFQGSAPGDLHLFPGIVK